MDELTKILTMGKITKISEHSFQFIEKCIHNLEERLAASKTQLNKSYHPTDEARLMAKTEYLSFFVQVLKNIGKPELKEVDWQIFIKGDKKLQLLPPNSIVSLVFGKKGIHTIKVSVCGDKAVGKTTFCQRLEGEPFDAQYYPTVAAAFSTAIFTVDYGTTMTIEAQIWDFAGTKHFESLRLDFYKGSSGAIYIYDITNLASFYQLFDQIAEC